MTTSSRWGCYHTREGATSTHLASVSSDVPRGAGEGPSLAGLARFHLALWAPHTAPQSRPPELCFPGRGKWPRLVCLFFVLWHQEPERPVGGAGWGGRGGGGAPVPIHSAFALPNKGPSGHSLSQKLPFTNGGTTPRRDNDLLTIEPDGAVNQCGAGTPRTRCLTQSCSDNPSYHQGLGRRVCCEMLCLGLNSEDSTEKGWGRLGSR